MLTTKELILSTVAAIAGVAALSNGGGAHADEDRMVSGLDGTSLYITQGWHSPGTSLDLVRNDGGATAGSNVAWKSVKEAGSRAMYMTTVQYGGLCTGVQLRVQADSFSGQDLGDYWFVHISPAVGVGTSWKSINIVGGFTTQNLGTDLADENATCKNNGLWTGPHLHQGGDNSPNTALYTNWALGYGQTLSPPADATNNWLHKYSY